MKLLSLFLLLLSFSCNAQKNIFVPHPAGGISDIVARTISNQDKNIQVINLPGTLTQSAQRAGYLNKQPLLIDISLIFIDPITFNLNFNVLSHYNEFFWFATSPNVIIVSTQNPSKNLSDFIKRANHLDLLFATSSSLTHIAAEEFIHKYKLKGRPIPYKGGINAIKSVAMGETIFHVNNLAAAKPLIEAGKLKILATSSSLNLKAQGYWGIALPENMSELDRQYWKTLIVNLINKKDKYSFDMFHVSNTTTWMKEQNDFYKKMLWKHTITGS